MKGVSTNNCSFQSNSLVVAIETQLTRGRVNDHPTQSRLYLKTDFDLLIIALDPALSLTYKKASGETDSNLTWEFYAIPVEDLGTHHVYQTRLKSLQKFTYHDLQKYRLEEDFYYKLLSST